MTDEINSQTQQQLPRKDERKPSGTGNGRNMKRSVSNSRPNNGGASSQGGTRPSSRSGGKKASTNAPESGSDTNSRRGSDTGRKPDARTKNQGNNRGVPNRRPSQGARGGSSHNTTREQPAKPTNAAPPPTEGSDALSSLQRVIADLKTTSPVPPAPASNPLTSVAQQSTLPANAPVFTPGASAYPGNPNHRKAASMGAGGYSSMNNFSPNLGSMMEDAEDGTGNATFEEGEIQDSYVPQQPTHQPRSQSQSFVPPRFAALAAAQQDRDNVGPTGRPQLAPNFMFGMRKRGIPMGPPISEEDTGFQFPQQQQPQYHQEPSPQERKGESGEITGIMAEQVGASLHHMFECSDVPYFRLPSRIKLRRYSNINKLYTNNNLPLVMYFPLGPLALRRIEETPTDAYKALCLLDSVLVMPSVRCRATWDSSAICPHSPLVLTINKAFRVDMGDDTV